MNNITYFIQFFGLIVGVLIYALLIHRVVVSFFSTAFGQSVAAFFGDSLYVIGSGMLGNVMTDLIVKGWGVSFTITSIAGLVFALCGAIIREFYGNSRRCNFKRLIFHILGDFVAGLGLGILGNIGFQSFSDQWLYDYAFAIYVGVPMSIIGSYIKRLYR